MNLKLGLNSKGKELPKELKNFLKKGKRLRNPSIFHPQNYLKFVCPERLYDEMTKCWHEKASERPSFRELANFFENYEDD